VTFVVTVTGTGNPGGTVQFLDGALNLGTTEVNGGQARLTTAFTLAGIHTINATYSGDGNHFGSVTQLSQVVNKVTPAVVLSSVPNTGDYGQNLTLTATVAVSPALVGVAAASGQVSFSDNGAVIGAASLIAGAASVSVSTLVPGAHQIAASYGGDTNWTAANSAVITVTVNRAATGTALSETATSTQTTLSAKVSGPVAVGAPGGSVQFMDGTTRWSFSKYRYI
jgi:hypothetical protein